MYDNNGDAFIITDTAMPYPDERTATVEVTPQLALAEFDRLVASLGSGVVVCCATVMISAMDRSLRNRWSSAPPRAWCASAAGTLSV